MKKFIFLLSLIFTLLGGFFYVDAQEIENSNLLSVDSIKKNKVSSEIIAPQYGKQAKELSFRANLYNFDLSNEYLEYIWDFGDGYSGRGMENVHVFTENGEYTVNLSVYDKERNLISSSSHQVKIAKEFYLVINDIDASQNELTYLFNNLRDKGNLLFSITYQESNDFIAELSSRYPLNQIDTFILLGDTLDFYNSILSFVQESATENIFSTKPIIIVNKYPFELLRSVVGNIKLLSQSSYIILLKNYTNVVDVLAQGNYSLIDNLYKLEGDYEVIGLSEDNLPWYRPLSKAVNGMLKHGVSLQYVWIFLALIIIITIIVFARQVIGFYTVNLYIPTLLSVAFLVLGLKLGVAFFLIILLSSILIRLLVKRVRILYMPSIALGTILLSLVVFFLISFLVANSYFQLSSLAILPILIIVMSSERFLSLHFNYTSKEAWFTILETVLIMLFAYALVSWSFLKFFVLTYPELIFLLIPINILLGRWKGLRILEYRRFYQIMHKEAQTDFDDILLK